jgi:hypothetical protein
MPIGTPYNGSQSPLEYYAINGNPNIGSGPYAGLGRLQLIQQTKIGTGKYVFSGPYKNPQITGNANDVYTATHTNARADATTPYNGKGTGDGITLGVYAAINNYAGGSTEDINGVPTSVGSGRVPQISYNASNWGYGPSAVAGSNYISPNTSGNIGQVII